MKSMPEVEILEVTIHPELEAMLQKAKRPQNYKKDERQTVYPIKKHEEIIAMANWLLENMERNMSLLLPLV